MAVFLLNLKYPSVADFVLRLSGNIGSRDYGGKAVG